jgi:hypothetical protein
MPLFSSSPVRETYTFVASHGLRGLELEQPAAASHRRLRTRRRIVERDQCR